MESYLNQLDAENPLVSVESVGKSFEQRDIWVVSVGYDYNPKILVDCTIHAREWVSPGMP